MTNAEIEARLANIRERCDCCASSHDEDIPWLLKQLALVQDLAAQREIMYRELLDKQLNARLQCGHPAQCAEEGDCVVCSLLKVQERMADAYEAQLAALQSQLDKALDERDRLLVFNQELDRERVKAIEERDAALARATCDGSFERQGEESELAAIAAVWNADPMVAYESPAQVIGWLEARASAAQATLKIEREEFAAYREASERGAIGMGAAISAGCEAEERLEAEAAALRKALGELTGRFCAAKLEIDRLNAARRD